MKCIDSEIFKILYSSKFINAKIKTIIENNYLKRKSSTKKNFDLDYFYIINHILLQLQKIIILSDKFNLSLDLDHIYRSLMFLNEHIRWIEIFPDMNKKLLGYISTTSHSDKMRIMCCFLEYSQKKETTYENIKESILIEFVEASSKRRHVLICKSFIEDFRNFKNTDETIDYPFFVNHD